MYNTRQIARKVGTSTALHDLLSSMEMHDKQRIDT